MNITIDDYEVIDRYAGPDRSWHDRVSTKAGVSKHLEYSKMIAHLAIISARIESRVPSKGDNHG